MKLLTCFLLLLGFSVSLHADWRTWRGPSKDGISTAKNLPDVWNEKENVLWKFALPAAGSSTPIVVGDKVFLTLEKDKEVRLYCISTMGRELWWHKVCETDGKGNGERTNASATPSSDGDRVFVTTGTGEVVAFDVSGNEKWRFNAQDRYGKFRFGFGFHSTTVLHEGRLFLQLIHSAAQLVVSVDSTTGKEVWNVERKSDGVAECEHSYASPTVHRQGDLSVLITHGNDYCIGHDPATGTELWRIADLNPKDRYNRTLRFVASPVASNGFVVAPSAKNRGVSVVRLAEAKGRIGKGGVGELWRMDKGTTDVTSPLLYEGILYLCKENGTVLCLDAKTGEQLYQERFHGQTYRGSPVAFNGRILFTARDGTFTLIKAGKSYNLLGKNKLDDEFTASPAISRDRLYLRGYKFLYAIGKK
ncbi:MAG: PQQ-binding-like beta-propeller repeat protein [Verrucomicrobia bacterium]|nr:PQQ-binding-like beta-propeller repeat protein [Verrucomicrobiota bacterium]MDA1047275.1 PQQ-binding-like beta-propeller repeat protein [Verrucomicrobiota bacterium]